MGEDTGLQYYFVDEDVDNGRTYYYAVTSYDKGYDEDFFDRGIVDEPLLAPVAPSECSKIIQTDLVGNVINIGRNCAVVVPNAPSAGYVEGNIGQGVVHESGIATGSVKVNVLLADSLKDNHTYRITFEDSSLARYTRSVIVEDVTLQDTVYVVNPYDEFELGNEIIDGLQFEFNNDSAMVTDFGWTEGEANMPATVALLESNKSLPLPEDFEIRVMQANADTSFDPLPFLRKPVNFQLWSTTTNKKYKFLFNEKTNKDGMLNFGDEIVVAYNIEGFRYNTAWRIVFGDSSEVENPRAPDEGDVFFFEVSKPFTSDDVYEFITYTSKRDKKLAADNLDNIYVVPDPYVVSASWEKPLFYSSGRGERRIDFVNLPTECTIRIFTISGRLVKTIEHRSTISNGSESWDLISDDGLTVSYGVYIFHVQAPGLGEKIGKFALIK